MTGTLVINPEFSFYSWGNGDPEQSGGSAKAMQFFMNRTRSTASCPDTHFSDFCFVLFFAFRPNPYMQIQIKTFFFWNQDIQMSVFTYGFTSFIKSKAPKM